MTLKWAAPRRAMSRGRGAERGDGVHGDADLGEQAGQLLDVVAVAEAERGGAEDVAARLRGAVGLDRQAADDLQEGLGGAEALLALVGGQFQRDHRDRQAEGLGEAGGVVLDQLGGAGGADDDRLGAEAVVGVAAGGLEELRGVGAEVAGLEGGVGDRRAVAAALDHGEEEVGVGVALRRVQHVVQAGHAGGDAHGADMRRAFVGPDAELHSRSAPRRRSGRAKRAARSPACS